MDLLNDLGLDIGTMGGMLLVFILAVLSILLPMSAYAAQKWAYKTYLETRSVNEKLGKLLELVQAGANIRPQPTPSAGKAGPKRREPTIGNADI
jgi:hypothetical protein